MKPRTLAIAGSIAAPSFAAVPIAQAATPQHRPAVETRLDRSRDAGGVRHLDKSRDARTGATSSDKRDR